MTTATKAKLSQLMIDALVGASKDEFGYQLGEIKRQTYVALEGRGLSEGGWLTPAGIEARSEHVSVADEPLAEVEQSVSRDELELYTQPLPESLHKAVDLDKPHVVPNRKDKRRNKFSVAAAWSRLKERQRVKAHKKFGDPIHRSGDVVKVKR